MKQTYLLNGREVDAATYYTRMVRLARERQRAFPLWSSSRRRWKRMEAAYMTALEETLGVGGDQHVG